MMDSINFWLNKNLKSRPQSLEWPIFTILNATCTYTTYDSTYDTYKLYMLIILTVNNTITLLTILTILKYLQYWQYFDCLINAWLYIVWITHKKRKTCYYNCNNQDVHERYKTYKTIILDGMVATILVIASWFEKHLTKSPPKEIANRVVARFKQSYKLIWLYTTLWILKELCLYFCCYSLQPGCTLAWLGVICLYYYS